MKILLAFILSVGSTLGAVVDDSVQVNASAMYSVTTTVLDKNGGKSVRNDVRRVVLYIRNISKNFLRIPTRGYDLVLSGDTNNKIAEITWSYSGAETERFIVIPEQDFGIVELRENETACLLLDWPIDWPAAEKMRIRMYIPSRIANRYRLDYFATPIQID